MRIPGGRPIPSLGLKLGDDRDRGTGGIGGARLDGGAGESGDVAGVARSGSDAGPADTWLSLIATPPPGIAWPSMRMWT